MVRRGRIRRFPRRGRFRHLGEFGAYGAETFHTCRVLPRRDKMGLSMNTRTKIANHIRLRNPFKIGNISAIRYNAEELPHTGRLPSYLADQLKGVLKDNDVYVIYSYATPIGWSRCDESDNWFIPQVKYSITTTHHQTTLKVITSTNTYNN